MSDLQDIPVDQLREAAAAWRRHDFVTSHYARALRENPLSQVWPFTWLVPGEPNLTVHDRIDQLIDEIERLRTK